MEWICIGLAVLCVALCVVALGCRREWQFESKMRRHLQVEYNIVGIRCLDLETQNKELNDLKTLAEQRYENERELRMDAELRVRELEEKLPKRDSNGRFCKREEE